ncbi:ATP adenylyltransferase-domain-containing protein [Zychaea mexicana]|uniref:ATP adenylyltransferase-domain-containing protein n=1 Tax=Zychaea mexicana TaxID=64656 RepID=UPI0022FDD219|nr:ATP adenylyltransferase-domain-containing protein [Zychaea mexicana]KAI9490847.1 ATP adenylyltransferase-domain-containing protein [Zychaea mexicana]
MTLHNQIQEKYDAALNSKELLFFETTKVLKEVDGLKFEITYAPSLAKKPSSDPTMEEKKKIKVNPFLPPNPALFVQDLDEHSVVLNKFCIVPHHIIVVTKEFKSQSQPLFPSDLLAAWQCMMTAFGTTPALAFYNCGPFSGASQPHKHMQILPLQGQQPQPPIKALFNQIQDRKAGQIYVMDKLPFVHVITPLDRNFIDSSTDNEELGDYLAQMFFGLLDAMFQQLRKHATPDREISYNFIMTDQFMMLVPRSRELATLVQENLQVSINSLGFAGMLLVKTPEELAALENHPDLMQVLKDVAYAWNPNADVEDPMEQ